MTGHVAAVDLGATSGRVIVGSIGEKTLALHSVARFANTPIRLPDGLHWSLLEMFGAALRGLRTAFSTQGEIASIGVDSWAVDYGLLREGRLLGAPFHYRDDRVASGVDAVHSRIPHAELYARNGLQFLPFNTLYQLAAEPEAQLEFADRLLLIPDLVDFWLTGSAGAERTNASTTGLLRVADGEWDDELITLLGLPRNLFPQLISPGDRVGGLLPEMSAMLGAGSRPVVTAVGSHDTASAVAAVPMHAESAVYISCGTWGLVGVEIERPVLTPAALDSNFTNERGLDGRVRFLRNVMGLWVLNETLAGWERDGEPADLKSLLAAAAEFRGNVPVFDIGDERFMAPSSTASDDMPSRIDQVCAEHSLAMPTSRVEYVRSIVESLAVAFAEAARTAEALSGVNVETIHLVGGGAQNSLLCQRTADHAGVPVLAGPVEATALGNVLVQARAMGFVQGSSEALRELVRLTHAPVRYEPRTRHNG